MVQCRTEMSPIVTTDWVPGLEEILVASSLTLLLSRVFTHCKDFTAIKSTPCRVYSRLRAQAGRSINVFCVYYRALPRTIDGAPPGPGATLANIYIYIHTYATQDHILHDYWPRCARQLWNLSLWSPVYSDHLFIAVIFSGPGKKKKSQYLYSSSNCTAYSVVTCLLCIAAT